MNFSSNISLPSKKLKVPTKTTINLVMKEETAGSVPKFIIGCIVVIIAACLISKFGVINILEKRDQAEAERNVAYSQYLAVEENLADYDEVMAEYRKYSLDWLDAESAPSIYGLVDRPEVLDLVSDVLMKRGNVESISISGNTLSVQMSGMTLDAISDMIVVLDSEPIVAGTYLSIAQTDEAREEALAAAQSGNSVAIGELSVTDTSDMSMTFSVTIALQEAAEGIGE